MTQMSNRLTDTENKLMVTKGETWQGGINQDVEINKYTLLYIKDLLYIYICYAMLSHIQLFATEWTVSHQAPLSMGCSRQEYWSGLSFPSPEDLPDVGMESASPALARGFFTSVYYMIPF